MRRGLPLLCACALVLGCEAETAEDAAAGAEGGAEAGGDEGDEGRRDGPVSMGDDEGEPAIDQRAAYVVRRIEFGRFVEGETNVTPGFDLDGRVSGPDDETSCYHPDYTSPDGEEGIDNQLAVLIPALEGIAGDAVDGLVQGAINDGALMILFEPRGDALGVAQGVGVPFLGTDGFILADQTLAVDPEVPWSPAPMRSLDADEPTFEAGPVDLPLPVDILNVHFTLNVADGRIRYTQHRDGTISGFMGGQINVAEVITAIDDGGVGSATRIAEQVLLGRADMAPDENGDCQDFSATLIFEAAPVYLADWDAGG